MTDRPHQPRTLTEDLRARSEEELDTLLRTRPDLLTPTPTDVTSLAARATTRASVTRALEQLDTFALQVVDAFVCLPDPTTYADILTLIGDTNHLGDAIERLRARALVWGRDELRIVHAVRDLIGPSPAATGPPLAVTLGSLGPARLADLLTDLVLPPADTPEEAVAAIRALFADPARMTALLADAPPQARKVLRTLAEGPPVGRVENAERRVRARTAHTPVEWLMARGLLATVDPHTVVLPREVALHLRGGRLHTDVAPRPPGLETIERDLAQVDRVAAGAAFTTTRHVENLLELWGVEPPPVLRAGGLGVRELRRTAVTLDVTDAEAAHYVEIAYTAGLLAASDDLDPSWLPTAAYDDWLARPTARRWTDLATAWLATNRVAGLIGGRDHRDKPVSALGPDLHHQIAPEVRHDLLAALADLPAGAASTPASLLARLRWQRPRQVGTRHDQLVEWTLQEAELFGVTGRGALSGAGRALLAGEPRAAADTLEPLLPTPLDYLLLQADLTAVAPGPLTSALTRGLALVADVESTGGATVYRFTAASIRRALDAGYSAADLHALFAEHSRTPVPQPLTYLVDDVARRHGQLRVGTAVAYLRCDDEAVLSELLVDRRAGELALCRLAPTVVISPTPVELLLDRLRSWGYAPAVEDPDGTVIVRRPKARRATAGRDVEPAR